ncbi:unnamed protein product [Amoebophrya sp. A25]|nr:unnamed protein product [Amoebophrya sp. A25]|eukprot:GSA25T00003578001.1
MLPCETREQPHMLLIRPFFLRGVALISKYLRSEEVVPSFRGTEDKSTASSFFYR